MKDQCKKSNYKQDIYDSLPSNNDVQSVDELYSEIFSWISMFDFNILVIMIVVVFVAILKFSNSDYYFGY